MPTGSSVCVTPSASSSWIVCTTASRLRLTTLIESEMWFTTKISSSPFTSPGRTATPTGSWPTLISATSLGWKGFDTSSIVSVPDVVLAT